jgi:hypothetical protein
MSSFAAWLLSVMVQFGWVDLQTTEGTEPVFDAPTGPAHATEKPSEDDEEESDDLQFRFDPTDIYNGF